MAVAGYTTDLLTKILAVEHLSNRTDDVPLLGDLLQLHLTRNPGAAFSAGTAYTPVLSVVALLASLVVLWVARRLGSRGWAYALGFLLAGILGNLTDRIFRTPGPFHGHVVDFLRLPHWPIFNVADVCINVAAGLILVLAFRGIRLDGGSTTDRASAPDPDASSDVDGAS